MFFGSHLYITGSINEPSGNHHIEAAQCGLPILYINSGGVKEYCKGYGLEYSVSNLEETLSIFMKDHAFYYENMKDYPFSSEKMCKDFENLFFISIPVVLDNNSKTELELPKSRELPKIRWSKI